jgi:hypothetical protein
MRGLGILLCSAALLGLGAVAAAAEESEAPWWGVGFDDHRAWTLALTGGAQRQDIDGDVRVALDFGDASVGTDALDFGRSTNGWGEVDLQAIQKHHLRFAYIPLEWNGDTLLALPIDFGGDTFDVSDRVVSRVKLDTYELSYRYDFYLGEQITLSPIVQMSLVDGRIEVADQTLGVGYDESQLVPVPALGLRAEVYPLSRIGVFAEGKGFTIGSQGTMWDAQGGVSLHPLRSLSLKASYRVQDYDVDYSGVEFDARMMGPFLAATLRF